MDIEDRKGNDSNLFDKTKTEEGPHKDTGGPFMEDEHSSAGFGLNCCKIDPKQLLGR